MMDIVMLVAGAGVGAMLRDLFVLYRGGEGKTRQQLESKTPYDYALTNAINERDRLRDELVTLRALNNVQTDTERIRNEIDTILPEGGEEATEGAYEHNIGMPIRDNGDGTFSPITWDNRISSGEMVDNISKAVARVHGTNVREDDTKDGQLAEDDVERSLINDIKDKTYENVDLAVEFAKMVVQDDEAIRKQLEETSEELSEEIKDVRRRMRKLREEGKYYGETLYRKGNR